MGSDPGDEREDVVSTAKIREALDVLRAAAPSSAIVSELRQAAMSEVEALEHAAKVLLAENIGDEVYRVRERCTEDRLYVGNTWEHPRVVAFGNACAVLSQVAKGRTS